jgi:N-acetylglucosamine-6-sulfatase
VLRSLWTWLPALAFLIGILLGGCTQKIDLTGKPNILLIISDDQRYDTMQFMPRTRERIFEQGVEFTSAYVTTARCCPSRASILTGMYAHNHKVYTNDSLLKETTFVRRFHDAGYYTGIIGKYLNSYPIDVEDRPRSEFDVWNVFPSGPVDALYYDNQMNLNGSVQVMEGYQTYVLRDLALSFLQDASEREEPFLLMFTPYAPHQPSEPAPGDEMLYTDLPPYRTPSYNEADVSDKPEWFDEVPLMDQETIEKIDRRRLRHIQSLNALDLSIESIIEELDRQGELDNTVILYMSDNGVFWGDYRLESGKVFVYEPATHVPFAIRYPPLVDDAFVSERLVANIDIAPTLFELAGLPIPENVDGMSLLPLLPNDPTTEWRDHLLIEGWPVNANPVSDMRVPFYQAIHTGRYVYVETEGQRSEFYDLVLDPYEIDNQIDNPGFADIIADLREKLNQERETIPPISREDLKNSRGD